MTLPSHDRPLGWGSAAALVVASMIGSGVFVTSGYTLAAFGSPDRVLAAWVVAGLVAVAGALGYGALARDVHESGGEYVYLARRVHPLAGFLAGWVSLIAGFTVSLALAAASFEVYLRPLLPLSVPPNGLALGIIALAAVQHLFRVEGGAWIQNGVVAIKLVGLGVLIAVGAAWRLGQPPPEVPAAAPPPLDWWTLGDQLTWIAVSYLGFNAAVYVAEEVRQPERNVPRAMLLATLGVFAIYLALNALFVYAGPLEELAGQGDIAAVAFALLGGPRAEVACRLLICLALVSSVSALTMSGPRVYAKMAADGLFPIPAPAAGQAPRAAILLQAGLAMLVVSVATLQQLLGYLGFLLSVSAAVTVGSLFLPGSPSSAAGWRRVAAGLFVVTTLTFAFMAAVRNPVPSAVAGGLTLVTGAIAYVLQRSFVERR